MVLVLVSKRRCTVGGLVKYTKTRDYITKINLLDVETFCQEKICVLNWNLRREKIQWEEADHKNRYDLTFSSELLTRNRFTRSDGTGKPFPSSNESICHNISLLTNKLTHPFCHSLKLSSKSSRIVNDGTMRVSLHTTKTLTITHYMTTATHQAMHFEA